MVSIVVCSAAKLQRSNSIAAPARAAAPAAACAAHAVPPNRAPSVAAGAAVPIAEAVAFRVSAHGLER
jgi:hypothetical protein